MAKLEVLQKDLALLVFEQYKKPFVPNEELKGYITWGEKNDYPSFLINLYEQCSEHGAIIDTKTAYLTGKGIKAVNEDQQPLADAFLSYANKNQSWEDLWRDELDQSLELFNGFYLEVITDLTGKPIEFYNIPFSQCRLNKEGTKLFYSEDYTRTWEYPEQEICIYEKGKVGRFFIPFKIATPKAKKIENIYPEPPYKSCIIDISSDTEISNFNYNYIFNGFSGGTIVTFFNGEPTPEEKREIKRRFEKTHTGTENAGKTVLNYADKDGKPVEITAMSVDDLDKKFEVISKRIQQKIITGHRVTNPELFGITKEGNALSTRQGLLESQELFLNSYVKPRQLKKLNFLQKICFLTTGQNIQFEIEQLDQLGLDLANDPDLTQDERRELKGYKPLTPIKVDANGNEITTEMQTEVNGNLKALTGKENQNLMRILRNYGNGKVSKEQASVLLKNGFGLNDADINTMLGIEEEDMQKFSAQKDAVLTKFESDAIDDEDDEVISEDFVHFKKSEDAIAFELSKQKMFFADALSISVKTLESAILNTLKGNPTTTPNQLAKMLGVDVAKVNSGLNGLLNKDLISPNADGFDPTEKAFDKLTKPFVSAQVYTVYKYALKSDAPNLVAGGSSRDFCKEMMRLSKTKHWRYETINSLSNDLGTNAWDYRGGFYNNPTTGETEPFCRHIWKAITKVKQK